MAATDLGVVLADIRDRLEKLEAGQETSRLDNASVQDTTIDVYRAGEVVQQWGVLPDGSVGTTHLDADEMPTPTAPLLVPVVGGFRVIWDGGFGDGFLAGLDTPTPLSLDHVDIHIELTDDFVASKLTRDDSISRKDGGVKEFRSTQYVPHFVRLVAVSASGKESAPSPLASVVPLLATATDIAANSIGSVQLQAGAVIPSNSATGTTGNLIPDSGFADQAWRDRRVAEQTGTRWTIAAGTDATSIGQAGYYAQCATSIIGPDGTDSAESFWLLPPPGVVANPGEKFYVAVWAARSADGAGRWVTQVVYLDAEGRELNISDESVSLWRQIEDLPDASLGNYQLFDATVEVPEPVAALGIRVTREDDQNGNTSGAGVLLIQKAELRSILTRSDPGRNRVEVGPNGVTAISGDGRVLASLDEQGTVTATSMTVSGSLTIDGTDLETTLAAMPQGEVLRTTCANPPSTTSSAYLLDTGFTAQPGRRYRIRTSRVIARQSQGGFRLRWTSQGEAPTASSPVLYYDSAPMSGTLQVDEPFAIGGSVPLQIRFWLEQVAWAGTAMNLDTSDANSGRITFSVLDEGIDVGETAPGTQRYTKQYAATWSRGWAQTGSQGYDNGGGMYQGRTGPNGDDYSAFGFNYAAIAADLAGATVENAWLFLSCNWASNGDGAYARVRTHGTSGPVNNGVYPAVSACRLLARFAVGEARWSELGATIANEFKSGATRGFALDSRDVGQNPADYGRWEGTGTGGKPVVRIQYRK